MMQAVSATCLLHKTVLQSAAAAVAIRQPRYFRHLFLSSCSQCKCTRKPRTLLSRSLFLRNKRFCWWHLLVFIAVCFKKSANFTILEEKIKHIFILYLFVKFSFFPLIQKSSDSCSYAKLAEIRKVMDRVTYRKYLI
jgi:hypothetical protein